RNDRFRHPGWRPIGHLLVEGRIDAAAGNIDLAIMNRRGLLAGCAQANNVLRRKGDLDDGYT
ncbi:MAG TPA: hypothetical protein PK051_09640, partial [Trichococcus flocculiformis]|nr:hypothetical protein [Trichococcus flocculiformis]